MSGIAKEAQNTKLCRAQAYCPGAHCVRRRWSAQTGSIKFSLGKSCWSPVLKVSEFPGSHLTPCSFSTRRQLWVCSFTPAFKGGAERRRCNFKGLCARQENGLRAKGHSRGPLKTKAPGIPAGPQVPALDNVARRSESRPQCLGHARCIGVSSPPPDSVSLLDSVLPEHGMRTDPVLAEARGADAKCAATSCRSAAPLARSSPALTPPLPGAARVPVRGGGIAGNRAGRGGVHWRPAPAPLPLLRRLTGPGHPPQPMSASWGGP